MHVVAAERQELGDAQKLPRGWRITKSGNVAENMLLWSVPRAAAGMCRWTSCMSG